MPCLVLPFLRVICPPTTCVCLFVLRTYHDEKDAVFDYACDINLTMISEIRLVERHQPRRFSQVMREKGPKRPGGVVVL